MLAHTGEGARETEEDLAPKLRFDHTVARRIEAACDKRGVTVGKASVVALQLESAQGEVAVELATLDPALRVDAIEEPEARIVRVQRCGDPSRFKERCRCRFGVLHASTTVYEYSTWPRVLK
jgi:hypothetical protein